MKRGFYSGEGLVSGKRTYSCGAFCNLSDYLQRGGRVHAARRVFAISRVLVGRLLRRQAVPVATSPAYFDGLI